LRADICTLGRNPSQEEKERVLERRDLLQIKVQTFQQQGIRFLPLTLEKVMKRGSS